MSFVDDLLKVVGPQVTEQLTSQLGLNQNQAQGALAKVAPLILGGLKRQMENKGGADRVDHILNKYGDAGALDDIQSVFNQRSRESQPDPGLGGLLGKSGHEATSLFSKEFGIDGSTAAKLIPMLAPIILGALSKRRDQGFGQVQQGQGSSGIAALLDQDGDGSILDDVAGMVFQSQMGGRQGGGTGLLGKLLGGLLGGRRQ